MKIQDKLIWELNCEKCNHKWGAAYPLMRVETKNGVKVCTFHWLDKKKTKVRRSTIKCPVCNSKEITFKELIKTKKKITLNKVKFKSKS
jgi:Zn finger protein HypA/HybF involved in hydrogenase expression